MYLKEVHMKNFKSFGKKNIVVKLSKGLTVISGPNGSGKSNISDALLFVTGGQRTQKLRAENYAGLIFDGGEKGKGAKASEVKLIFDNEDRKISVDVDTVEFTKKIKMKAGADKAIKTYYYINGKASSHGEFHNIFSAARLSSDGYNVVQQGTVNDIASRTPKQRRVILDDIAGITSFDEALDRSSKRKEKVEFHLKELDVLVSEIDGRLRQLRNERNGARRYKKYQDELSGARATLAFAKKELLEINIKNITDRIEEDNGIIQSSKEEIGTLNEKRKELVLRMRELEKKMDDMQDDESKRLVKEIKEFELELNRARDRKIISQDSIAELDEVLLERTDDIQKGEKELGRFVKEEQTLSKRLERENARFDKADREYNEISESMKDSSEKFQGLKEEQMRAGKELEILETEHHQISLEREAIADRIERRTNELGADEESVNNLQLEVNEVKWKIKEKSKEREAAKKREKKLDSRFAKIKSQMVSYKKEEKDVEISVSQLNQEYNKLRVKRRIAEESGYGLAVQKVLEASDRKELPGIHGTIAQLARVDKAYEIALSTAAGGGMQAMVTKDDGTAAKAIKYLKKNRYGRAMFLPLNKMSGGRAGGRSLMVADNPGVIGFAMDLIDFDPKFRKAFWYVFSDTLVVENLKTAREYMGGVRLVTLDGQLIERSGAMVGGSRMKRLLKFGKKEDKRYNDLRKELDNATQRQQEIAEKLKGILDEFSVVDEDIRNVTLEISQLDGEINALEVNLKEFVNRLDRVVGDRKGVVDGISHEKEELEKTGKKIGEKDERIKEKKKEISRLEARAVKTFPEKLQKRMEKLKETRTDLMEKIMGFKSRREILVTQIELYESRLAELKESARTLQENIDKQNEIIRQADKDSVHYEEEVEKRLSVEAKLSEKIRDIKKEYDEAKEGKWDAEKRMEVLRKEIGAKNYLIINQNGSLADLREKLGKVMVKVSSYGDAIEAPYPSREELKFKIAKCEKRMAKLEPVNMRALEEYERVEQRKEGIVVKYDKLVEEEGSLTKMMTDVKKKKKAKLLDVFENVDANFREMYPKICTNGEGYLHLQNKNEPFEGGLIIRARPPGKKMRDIKYLSGGEKSQVAIAFILALQRYDPSPFYVLDEVDQNLDMVNSEVIATMIKQYSVAAQFIMISLHKIIMNYADHLYGCYIKDGISKMVAIPNVQDIPDTEEEEKKKKGKGGGKGTALAKVSGEEEENGSVKDDEALAVVEKKKE